MSSNIISSQLLNTIWLEDFVHFTEIFQRRKKGFLIEPRLCTTKVCQLFRFTIQDHLVSWSFIAARNCLQSTFFCSSKSWKWMLQFFCCCFKTSSFSLLSFFFARASCIASNRRLARRRLQARTRFHAQIFDDSHPYPLPHGPPFIRF